MKAHMDYSSPVTIMQSGARAFNLGIAKSDCPISQRTHANAALWWNDGWDKEAAKTCKGTNCTAKRGAGHSSECIQEHDEAASPADPTEIFPGTRKALDKLSV